MTDDALIRSLRELVVRWRANAAHELRVSFCADELTAVLDRPAPPQDEEKQLPTVCFDCGARRHVYGGCPKCGSYSLKEAAAHD